MKPIRLYATLATAAAAAALSGCSSTTEEHIRASADEIQFSRVVGRKAAAAGLRLNKDSLVINPIN